MRCSPHHYYFGTPTGTLHRHLIPVHIVVLRRMRDGMAPRVAGTKRLPASGCAVWRNGLQQRRYSALCALTSVDARAYRLRTQPKQVAAPRL
jgi:hypothetical protein